MVRAGFVTVYVDKKGKEGIIFIYKGELEAGLRKDNAS